ncbi:MAG TPA: hypothetical protein VF067_04240 [Sphingomicrobium sp.]
MTKIHLIAAAAALATQAQAQDPGQAQAPAQAAPQANLRGNWLQADMTRQQALQRADTLFQRLDSNHDGVLTKQEAEQATSQSGGQGGGRFAARMAERLFAQGDSVTKAQFDAQALARFERMDLNHDGVVTADERQQARGQRRQERGN